MTDLLPKDAEQTQELPEEHREVVFEEALEAMLFAAGHPLTYATIGRVLDMTAVKVKENVMAYAMRYNMSELPRGVILLTYADACQLCTKDAYLHEIRDALGIRKSGSLSTSSMEALAIVAYNQPVTRIFVDTLRRADSSYAMNNLLDRGLIESVGRLDAPGRPMLYATTKDFLRCFGLSDISELPQTTEEMVNMFAKASNVAEDGAMEGAEQIELDLPTEKTDASEQVHMATTAEPADTEAPKTAAAMSVFDDDTLPSAEDDAVADTD